MLRWHWNIAWRGSKLYSNFNTRLFNIWSLYLMYLILYNQLPQRAIICSYHWLVDSFVSLVFVSFSSRCTCHFLMDISQIKLWLKQILQSLQTAARSKFQNLVVRFGGKKCLIIKWKNHFIHIFTNHFPRKLDEC